MQPPRRNFGLQLDEKRRTMKLTSFKDKKVTAALSYQLPKPDLMTLDGTLAGQKLACSSTGWTPRSSRSTAAASTG